MTGALNLAVNYGLMRFNRRSTQSRRCARRTLATSSGADIIGTDEHTSSDLLETLPVLQRFALAYCPAAAKPETLALFALDARLAGIVRSASEPMLGQIRLAWWREILAKPADEWPVGDPLLARLECWQAQAKALGKLVDGWEALVVDGILSLPAMDHLASARGDAFAALARLLDEDRCREAASRMGRNWALADIALRLRDPAERDAAVGLARKQNWDSVRMPRRLRALNVLHGIAARQIRQSTGTDGLRRADLLAAVRIGLLGR